MSTWCWFNIVQHCDIEAVNDVNVVWGTQCWHDVNSILVTLINNVYLFVCLFVVFRPTWGFFTHMEMSILPVKGCKFWPMLGTRGHWAVRVLKRATLTVTRGIRLLWPSPFAERLTVELPLPVFTTWVYRDWYSNPNLPLAGRTL